MRKKLVSTNLISRPLKFRIWGFEIKRLQAHNFVCVKGVFSFIVISQLRRPIELKFSKVCYFMHTVCIWDTPGEKTGLRQLPIVPSDFIKPPRPQWPHLRTFTICDRSFSSCHWAHPCEHCGVDPGKLIERTLCISLNVWRHSPRLVNFRQRLASKTGVWFNLWAH